MEAKFIINISSAKKTPFSLNKEDGIIDFKKTITDIHKNEISSVFINDEILKKSLDNYILFTKKIALFSKKKLNYHINTFNIFFITNPSVKHAIYFWANDFFILQNILICKKNEIELKFSSIILLLPDNLKFIEKEFNQWFALLNYKIPITFYYDKNNGTKINLFLILKTTLINLFKINGFKPNTDNRQKIHNNQSNIFLINRISDKHSYNNIYVEIKKLFNNKQRDLGILPITDWQKQDNIDIDFYYAKPHIFQQIWFCAQLIFLCLRITFFKTSESIKIDKLNIPLSFLKFELIQGLYKFNNLLILHIWLINYLKRKKYRINFFFEDEFYETGRIISSAIHYANKDKKIKHRAFGLQHGHFNETHTVYTITDEDIQTGLPLPDKFICWGNYYKKIFLSHNTISEKFVEVLGNPKYVNNYSLSMPSFTEVKNILWCLTSKACLETEWNIIKQHSSLNSFNITIRLHPVGHIKADELKDLVKGLNYKLSNLPRIEDEFAQNDLIICSAHSTIFLDAMLFKKYCIRIVSRLWVGNNSFDNPLLYTIKNFDEFNNAINQITFKKIDWNIQHASNILEFNKDKWYKFIDKLKDA